MTVISGISSALNFTIQSPTEISIGEEFEVKINSDSQENYDVKIFAYSGSKSNYISQIYKENQWKSPHFYLMEAYPTTNNFKIKLINNTDDSEICVRMRLHGATQYEEICQEIETTLEENFVEEESEEDEINTNVVESIPVESNLVNSSLNKVNLVEANDLKYTEVKNQKIVLGGKSNVRESNIEITSAYKTRIGIIYFFVSICVLLVILMALRKL
ncbi:MAG: hypothetical protein ACP5NS_04735 [Candidatus Pacearchaeota archaeon]